MLRKIVIILITTLTLNLNVSAETNEKTIFKKNDPSGIEDCSEGFNRASFALNQGLDKVVFKPVAKLYKSLPSPIKSGTGNVLDNLSNLVTIPNNILQGDFKEAGINSGRFVVNSTLGILGLFDVAEQMGLIEYKKEDYGQSLAVAGIGPGCYLVLPVLGPSTARDTISSVANFVGGDAWYNVTVKNDTQYFSDFDYYGSKATSGVDFRAKNYNSIENLEKNSLDFYASVKSLYLQDRQQKILNTSKVINTLNDNDWEEFN